MEFCKTQTFFNLARSFAGECQAGMRYQLTAKAAMKEGLTVLADTIRTIAKNETNHARVFFETILAHAGSQEDVHIDAHYPFHAGTLAESLRFAMQDEQSEAEELYPAFARTAREEGFADIARKFELTANVESHHKIIFDYLAGAMRTGALYAQETPMLWICGECGYMHTSKEAFKVCPLCGAPQGDVQLHLPFAKEKV